MVQPLLTIYRGRETLLLKVRLANTFASRLRGLMFFQSMPKIDGLMLSPANSIHTFWMRFPLDLIYIDGNGKVINTYNNVIPNRICPTVKGGIYVLETAVGTIASKVIEKGDLLWW